MTSEDRVNALVVSDVLLHEDCIGAVLNISWEESSGALSSLAVAMPSIDSTSERLECNTGVASSYSCSSEDTPTSGDWDDILSDSVVCESHDVFLVDSLISSSWICRENSKFSFEAYISFDSSIFSSVSSLTNTSSDLISSSKIITLSSF